MRTRTSSFQSLPGRPRRGLARARPGRGFSLTELLVTVALLGVMAGLSASALGPLQANFLRRDAASRVAAALHRARLGARDTGRCHLVSVYNGVILVAPGTFGDRLRVQRRTTADCETAPTPADWEDVEWVPLPARTRVRLVAGPEPVWRPNGRLQGAADEFRVEAAGAELSVQLAVVGAVCLGDVPPGACP